MNATSALRRTNEELAELIKDQFLSALGMRAESETAREMYVDVYYGIIRVSWSYSYYMKNLRACKAAIALIEKQVATRHGETQRVDGCLKVKLPRMQVNCRTLKA